MNKALTEFNGCIIHFRSGLDVEIIVNEGETAKDVLSRVCGGIQKNGKNTFLEVAGAMTTADTYFMYKTSEILGIELGINPDIDFINDWSEE